MDTILKKLKKETIAKKTILKKKYEKKVVHLENERRLELEEKRRNRAVLKELEDFKDIRKDGVVG